MSTGRIGYGPEVDSLDGWPCGGAHPRREPGTRRNGGCRSTLNARLEPFVAAGWRAAGAPGGICVTVSGLTALAHTIKAKAEAAYARNDLFEKRGAPWSRGRVFWGVTSRFRPFVFRQLVACVSLGALDRWQSRTAPWLTRVKVFPRPASTGLPHGCSNFLMGLGPLLVHGHRPPTQYFVVDSLHEQMHRRH